MNDNAFDEALRRVVADEKLPDAPDAWSRMAARLDAHSAGKKQRRLVLPLPAIRWAAAAAVVAAALATGWWLRDASVENTTNEPRIAQQSYSTSSTTQSNTTPTAQETTPAEQPNTHEQPVGKFVRQSVPNKAQSSKKNQRVVSPTAPLQNNSQEAIATASTPSVPSPAQPTPKGETPPKPSPRQSASSRFTFLPEETTAPKTTRSTGFDVAGGYGFGGEIPAFSVGVAVKRPLTRRLQLEGALALVGSTPDPFGSATKSDDATSSGFNFGNTSGTPSVGSASEPGVSAQAVAAQQAAAAEEEYQEIRARQLFVQAAPVLMYRVAGGLSAGGGLDAQRRVSGSSAQREERINSFDGVSVPALPDWDFGLALRADYRVTKKLRFGVQYRESLRATAANGAKAAGRNYWLLQAGYRIR